MDCLCAHRNATLCLFPRCLAKHQNNSLVSARISQSSPYINLYYPDNNATLWPNEIYMHIAQGTQLYASKLLCARILLRLVTCIIIQLK